MPTQWMSASSRSMRRVRKRTRDAEWFMLIGMIVVVAVLIAVAVLVSYPRR